MNVTPPLCSLAKRLGLAIALTFSVSALAQTELIAPGAAWKYLDTGDNLSEFWRPASYNDQSWKTGKAKFGYGIGNETTVIDAGPWFNHKHITTYFRKTFTVANPASASNYRLRLLRSDGAVVYLNGQEIFRSNMPSGRVGYITLANTTVSTAESATFIETTIPANLFIAGNNVLAVEIHKATGYSSVLNFDLSLTTDGSGQPIVPAAPVTNLAREPYLQLGTTNSIVVRWRTATATDSRVSYGDNPARLALSKTDATVSTEHSLQLTNLLPNTKYYYSVGSTGQVMAGGDDSYSFVTAPSTSKPTRVWVLGDAGTNTSAQRSVRDAYARFAGERATDVWLLLGDNAYETGTDSEYQKAFFDIYPSFLRQSVVWPTIGNHDTAGSATPPSDLPYYQMFTFPARGEAGGMASGTKNYYSFDYGSIHFVCLDSMTSDRSPNGAMLRWLTNDLAANTKPWIIAYWHHPPYSKGSHDSDDDQTQAEMRQNALPILEAYGVDLVLAGHSHSYERSYLIDGHYGKSNTFTNNHKKNGGNGRVEGNGAYLKSTFGPSAHEGAVYAVAGSGGQASSGALNHPAMYISLQQLGSMVLDINGNRLDAKFLRETGAVDDSFTIIKGSSPASTGVVTIRSMARRARNIR